MISTSDPTSMMWPLFQGRTCVPTDDPSGTCTLGGYASYSIDVENVAQVQLGVNFARNMDLRLTVKNTGHGKCPLYGLYVRHILTSHAYI